MAVALDDGPSGSSRIENEYKLNMPLDKYETVWNFLVDTYVTRKSLSAIDPDYTTSPSVEFFSDQYFDDDAHSLLSRQHGVRIRSRFIPDDPANPKNGRRLLQVKMSNIDEKADLNRAEIKFEINTKAGHNLKHLIPYIQPRDLHDVAGVLRDLDVDIRELKKKITLGQERRRVYISYRNAPFATITLDKVDTSFMMWGCTFAEVEIELNEILYTAVSGDRREDMEKVSGFIKTGLEKQFPFISRDQTPKYNKASQCLGDKAPFYETLVNLF
ncbi:MAG: CYTH domain-containing protein [Rhodospirillales bacterium]